MALLPLTQADAAAGSAAKPIDTRVQPSGCRSWLGRNWNLILPGTTLLSAVGAVGSIFAGLAATVTGTLTVVAAAGGIGSCIVIGCQNSRPSAQQQLDQLDQAVDGEKKMATDLQHTADTVHDVTVAIHRDTIALEGLQAKVEASEKEAARLADELQKTSEKLAELQPLYEQLKAVLAGVEKQTGAIAQSHLDHAIAAQTLAAGVDGIALDAKDLADIHAHIQGATQAAATKNEELGVNIQAFTALVRDLITAHELLKEKSLALQEEIQQAQVVQEENHRLAEQAQILSAEVQTLENKLRSFQGLDAAHVHDILGFLRQNQQAFQSYVIQQLQQA